MVTPPTPDAFRTVMSRFATGVTVMTTIASDGPHGMTANAVSSVSLDPLLVLVCVERDTQMSELVADTGVFGLSILAADQREISDRFAVPDRPTGATQFSNLGTTTAATGAPLLAGALAWVDCRVWACYDGGDHLIVVGEVAETALAEADTDALVYFRGDYTVAPAPATPRR